MPQATRTTWPADGVLGTLVAGRFAVIDVLGVGGFGAVYRALQQSVGRVVALKLIHPRLDGAEQVRARFFREARVVAGLNDPTVVTLFDYGEQPDGMIFMAFELVEGVPLGDLLRNGPLEPDHAVGLMLQVLRALAVAHRRGLVHRDIKPANIMVRRDEFGQDTVKVLDFGIAKITQREEGEEATLQTREGMLLGTPRYMAPEQARGVDSVDARADLYAAGVILYELLSGRPPFAGNTPLEVAVAHVTQAPPPLDPSLRLPPALVAVVMRALAKRPDDRFENAAAMADALRLALPELRQSTGTIAYAPETKAVLALAPDPSIDEPGLAPAPPRRTWVVPAVVGGLVVAAVGIWLALRPPTSAGSGAGPQATPVTAGPVTAGPVTAGPHQGLGAPASAAGTDAAPADAAPADAAPPVDAAPVDATRDAAPDARFVAPPTAPPAAPVTRRPRPVRPDAPATLEVPEF